MAMKGHQSLLGKIDHGKSKLKLKLNALLSNYRVDNPVRARKVPGSKLTTLRILEEQHFGSLTCHVLRSKVSTKCYVPFLSIQC